MHEITSSDGFFAVRTAAWHGLGHVYEDYPSRQEAQLLAHPWEPTQEPLFRKHTLVTPDGIEHVSHSEVDGWVVNVRNDDAHALGVVNKSYNLVSNNSLWDVAEALEKSGDDVMYETGGSLRGGAMVWVLVRLKEPLMVKGDKRGETIPYFALQNSHDGSGAFRGQATMTRIVCHAVGTPVLHKGEWINVEDHPGVMAIKDEDGLRVNLAGLPKSLAETVTLDHKYWAKLPGEGPQWVMARDLTEEHLIGYPIPKGSEVIGTMVPLEFKDDYEDFWWAVGLFWGDGNLVGSRQVCWSVSDPALEVRLTAFLNRHGFTGKGTQRPGVRQITWSNKEFHDFVAPFYRGEGRGKGSRSKYPTSQVEEISIEELSALVDGYYDSDGSEDKNRGGQIWSSTELESLLSLRRMLMRLGRPSLIRTGRKEAYTSEIDGRIINGKPSYTLRVPAGPSIIEIEGDWTWSPVTLVEWAGVNSFVPLDIPEDDHVYTTHFGRSHNCANTSRVADMDAKARGTEFTFRHSKNVQDRISEAQEALSGWRQSLTDWQDSMEELLALKVNTTNTTKFLHRFIPMPPPNLISDLVEQNIHKARDQWKECYNGITGEGLEGTAYGLVQASTEYQEWYRRANNAESRFRRSFLNKNAIVASAVELAKQAAAESI